MTAGDCTHISPVDKLCGVDPRDLERLGIEHVDGLFRMGAFWTNGGEVVPDEVVLKLIQLLKRGQGTSVEDMRAARAFAEGLDINACRQLYQACRERVVVGGMG